MLFSRKNAEPSKLFPFFSDLKKKIAAAAAVAGASAAKASAADLVNLKWKLTVGLSRWLTKCLSEIKQHETKLN